jgi:hypothetical protein
MHTITRWTRGLTLAAAAGLMLGGAAAAPAQGMAPGPGTPGTIPGSAPGPSAPAGNGPAVQLQFNVPVGTRMNVQETQQLRLSGTASDGWGNRQPINQSFGGVVQYQLEVLGAERGMPNHIKLTFAPNLSFQMSDGQNPPQSDPMPFAGKTYEVRLNNGQPSVQPQQGLDPESLQYLGEIATFIWRDLLPARPVGVQQSWQPDATRFAQGMSMDPGTRMQINAQLAGMSQFEQRPAADVGMQVQINGTMQGLPMQGSLQGRAVVDRDTGLVVSAQLQGELPMNMQGPEGSLQGKAAWQIGRQVSNLQSGGGFGPGAFDGPGEEAGPGAFDGPGGAGEVFIGGEEEDDPAGPAGPSVNGQQAPPFAGTFSNEQLGVTLIERQSEQVGRSIEIRRGDLVTQGWLTGNRDINMTVGDDGRTQMRVTFQGYFEHNGQRYEFSAEQPSPQQLNFTTGRTTHALTLERPATQEESPPNPFE